MLMHASKWAVKPRYWCRSAGADDPQGITYHNWRDSKSYPWPGWEGALAFLEAHSVNAFRFRDQLVIVAVSPFHQSRGHA